MTAKELVTGYLSSFESADPEMIASHVAEDFENDQVGVLGTPCRGREVYQQRLAGFLNSFKKLRYSIEEMITEDDRVAVSYVMYAEDNNQPIEIRGVMIIFINEGQISKRSDYWDGLSYQQQMEADV
jgi:ketosteroid isomerase-like protein